MKSRYCKILNGKYFAAWMCSLNGFFLFPITIATVRTIEVFLSKDVGTRFNDFEVIHATVKVQHRRS